jgi:hypothetical protein
MHSLQKLTEKPFVRTIWADGITRETSSRAVFEIDTTKAKYANQTWDKMTHYERKKFENMLVLENPRIRLQFKYI